MIGYYLIAGVFMLLGWIVQTRLKNKFRKYSEVRLNRDLSGAEIARLMLADHGIHDVEVVSVDGELTDNYNPSTKIVNLSEGVYNGHSASAAAVAAHECGHAVQHATAYAMLSLRSAMVPIQNISGTVLNYVMMAMFFGAFFVRGFLPINLALTILIACYGVFAIFALITLPVEFDASRRALAWVKTRNIVTPDEYGMAKDALKWAAMTYLVAALSAITMLFYYVMMLLGARDRS